MCQVERQVRPDVAVTHGSDEHLTLLGAQWHLNMLTGQDRADMLAFGRACMEAERNRCRYPQCVENEDELCPSWLTSECQGPTFELRRSPRRRDA